MVGQPNVLETVAIQGIVRGRIQTLSTEPAVDAMSLRLREKVPDLSLHDSISFEVSMLDRDQSECLGRVKKLDIQKFYHPPVKVAGIQQYLFMLYGTRRYVAGLASVRLRVRDEVWQFDHTPVAIIVRRDGQCFDFIGRAFLFPVINPAQPRDRFGEQLSFVKDSSSRGKRTPILDVELRDLYELMRWVNFD